MSSSFVAKTLNSRDYKGREATSTSPTRKYSINKAGDDETAARKHTPTKRHESLSRYDIGPSSGSSKKKRKSQSSTTLPVTSPRTNDGYPTQRIAGEIVSPTTQRRSVSRRRSSSVAKVEAWDVPPESMTSESVEPSSQSRSRRRSSSATKRGSKSAAKASSGEGDDESMEPASQSRRQRPSSARRDSRTTRDRQEEPKPRRSSRGKMESLTNPKPMILVDSSARLEETPFFNEMTTSPPQRRTSYGDQLRNLSKTRPELSTSPLVPAVSMSPMDDFFSSRTQTDSASDNFQTSQNQQDRERDFRQLVSPSQSSYLEFPSSSREGFRPSAAAFETSRNASVFSPTPALRVSMTEGKGGFRPSAAAFEPSRTSSVFNVSPGALRPPMTERIQPSVAAFQSPTREGVDPSAAVLQSSAKEEGGGGGGKGGALGIAFMTKPLSPNASSSEPAASPPPASNVGEDGATVVQCPSPNSETATAEGSKIITPQQQISEDPEAKRRMKVSGTLDRARHRLTKISHETKKRRRKFGTWCWFCGCCGRLCRFIFDIRQTISIGKGPKVLRLWVESLKSIETNYGSSMMLVFAFTRWLFLLNAVLAVLWTAAMIVPFMAHPPRTFNWKTFFHSFSAKADLKYIVQGEHLDKSFVYYGGYMYTRSEQPGHYRVDYMYAVLIVVTFLASYLAAAWRIADRIMSGGHIDMGAQFFPFSALVFSSWDFHITSIQAAEKLQSGIRMHLKEMLADAKVRNARIGHKRQFMSLQKFVALFILWPMLVAGNVAAVIMLVKKSAVINDKFGSQYAQSVLLSSLNGIMPMVIRVLVGVEDFRPATAEKVILAKLFCLRMVNLGTLFYRLFIMIRNTTAVANGAKPIATCGAKSMCSEGFTCCTKVNMTSWNICSTQDINMCLPGCTENEVGAQLLRLITMTTLLRVASELVYGYSYVWTRRGKKRQFLMEDMVIDIVYIQALVWVGVCFSPMAAVLGFISNFISWYTMRFALFKTCAPVEKAYSASRTSYMTFGLLLFTIILCTIPAVFTIVQKRSGFCGPIPQESSMYSVISGYIHEAPKRLWRALNVIFNPVLLLGVILLLVFVVVIVQSQLSQTQQFLALTKYEMSTRREESQTKLRRVRQTLMQGDIQATIFSKSGRLRLSATEAPSEGSRSRSPLLPGQVEPQNP